MLTQNRNVLFLFLANIRAAELGQKIKQLGDKKVTDVVFDSSGLKVYGEGEWKVKNMVKAREEHGEKSI